MKKKISSIDYIRKYLKEVGEEPLKRIKQGQYEMYAEDYRILVTKRPQEEEVTFEYRDMRFFNISFRRLEKICRAFCDENFTVSHDDNHVIFVYKDKIYRDHTVDYAVFFLCDGVKCFHEEVEQQTHGKGCLSDARRAERLIKKMDEKNNTDEYAYSPFHSSKSTDGMGLSAVAGMDDLKRMLHRDFIDILKHKEVAKEYGITPPNGLLLYGPPGCGKSFIAERLAEETGMCYCIIKPSDLASSLVHGTVDKIRDLFVEAQTYAPRLIVFEEFDAIAPVRGLHGAEYQAEEVNELLAQLNNCAEKGVYVMATSNHPEKIDRAILRKGRMDKCIYIPMPDEQTRSMIFALSLINKLRDDDIDVYKLSQMTDGYSASDISYIVQEAARECFEHSIQNPSQEMERISQSLLETIIKETTPSVSAADLNKYNKVREELSDRDVIKNGHRRIGFE